MSRLSVLSVLCLLLLTACNPDYGNMAERRLAFARQNSGDIHIAAIQDLERSAFLDGVMLAAEEINQRPNKLLGRKIRIHIEEDGVDFNASKSTIRRIANNPKITAVIGHRSPDTVIPASVIYERSQVIFMPPFATADKLTSYYFNYVFRMIPGHVVMAEQVASVAKNLGYRNIVLLYARDDLSRELAFLVEDAVLNQNINVVSRSSFFEKDDNYRSIIADFTSYSFDTVFIAAPAKVAGKMVRQLREMGVNQPLLGSNLLNSQDYLDTAGSHAENTIIPDVFSLKKTIPRIATFVEIYKEKYNKEPDFNAAQGYDSLMLLAHGIERAGSTLPSLLSSTLHYMPAWVGVTGIHAFDNVGEMQGKKYLFKAWQNGQWRSMPAIEVPYTLERFTSNLGSDYAFTQAFYEKMHADDHKALLLDLAQYILDFKRLGVIYEDSDNGKKTANYELLQSLAQRKELIIKKCRVPFSLLEKKDSEQAIVACYGKLSLEVDTMFIPPYPSINSDLLERLNGNLSFFEIPSLSLDTRNNSSNISLILSERSDVNLRGTGDMQVYSSLLKNLKVHEFASNLKNLPEIKINLVKLQSYGISDASILLLSPDHYLEESHP